MALPNPHILSHVEAAAVTEEVSFTAVPAKMPNPSPDVVLKPRKLPKIGKIIAARTLKKKITEMDWATSSSSALITGAVAGNGGTATDGGAYTNEGGALRGNGQYLIEEKGNQKGDGDGAEDNRQGLLAGFQNYG